MSEVRERGYLMYSPWKMESIYFNRKTSVPATWPTLSFRLLGGEHPLRVHLSDNAFPPS